MTFSYLDYLSDAYIYIQLMKSGVLSQIRHGRGSGRGGERKGWPDGNTLGLLDKMLLCFMLGNLVHIYTYALCVFIINDSLPG